MRSRHPSPNIYSNKQPTITAARLAIIVPAAEVQLQSNRMSMQDANSGSMTEVRQCNSPPPRLESSGDADLLLSLAERAAEHASSPSSSSVTSTPSTPPRASNSGGQATRRAVSAERPAVDHANITGSNGSKRHAPLPEADSSLDADNRLPSPKRGRPTDNNNNNNNIAEHAIAALAMDGDLVGGEPKRIISPVETKPDDDSSEEDEAKASKDFHSKNQHGYNMFSHGPPHCLFSPPTSAAEQQQQGYPPMPYGPPYSFAHAFYASPYPYGMHPHVMYAHSPYMPPPPQQHPAHPPSAVRFTSAKTTGKAASTVRPATKSSTKPKAHGKPAATLAKATVKKPPSPKAMKTLPKKQTEVKSEEEYSEMVRQQHEEGREQEAAQSMNRCVPRKYLYPPLDWRQRCLEVDSVQVPDFHLLVNYPDYLARGRSNTSGSTAHEKTGMKHCVMCGRARASTSSTLVGRGSTKRSDLVESQLEPATHIIPRQNKGVCTACDVAVWVVASNSGPPPSEDPDAERKELEIKWCKGCKNFRPWPAFGDKVLATKCVRCRERQKEKYAAQKGTVLKTEDDVFAADVLRRFGQS
ncbi:hypothetical protein MPSEU_000151600 [Mayamaea pseudoterrestris]|nr:hypothetical protein MPSEU_000151600 [Mayamaea pseudoterrestris]